MVDILVVLDRSGSMQDAADDHEGGLRSFVKDQQAAGEDAYFTLIQFDTANPCEVVYDRTPIRDVRLEDIRLIPRGGTPLLDAIGKAVAHLEEKQAKQKSDATVMMVITDGEENSSTECTLSQVKNRLSKAEKNGWKVLYLGANVDAFGESSKLGLLASAAANFKNVPGGTNNLYRVTSAKLGATRSAGLTGQSFASSMSYTVQEQELINTVESDLSDDHK